MASGEPETNLTTTAVAKRETAGAVALGALVAWGVYITGLLPWAWDAVLGIEDNTTRIAVAMAAIASGVFAVANVGSLVKLLRPLSRRLTNFFTPVLPEAVLAARIAELRAQHETIAQSCKELTFARERLDLEVARLTREQEAVLSYARDNSHSADDALLGRRLNRAQEALQLATTRQEEARASEELLVDARELCDMCVQRLQSALERYRSTTELAKTGLRAALGDSGEAQRTAERLAMDELNQVDLRMANLEDSRHDRKLGDRLAALRIAEVRKATGVRVDAGEAEPAEVEAEAEAQHGERRRRS
ncbi:MAG: hypothetical protein HY909_26185 [Deltaproteobacteria bacterium]|nr:hypothetical protein [Deltaproteobacteria bacterium]